MFSESLLSFKKAGNVTETQSEARAHRAPPAGRLQYIKVANMQQV